MLFSLKGSMKIGLIAVPWTFPFSLSDGTLIISSVDIPVKRSMPYMISGGQWHWWLGTICCTWVFFTRTKLSGCALEAHWPECKISKQWRVLAVKLNGLRPARKALATNKHHDVGHENGQIGQAKVFLWPPGRRIHRSQNRAKKSKSFSQHDIANRRVTQSISEYESDVTLDVSSFSGLCYWLERSPSLTRPLTR